LTADSAEDTDRQDRESPGKQGAVRDRRLCPPTQACAASPSSAKSAKSASLLCSVTRTASSLGRLKRAWERKWTAVQCRSSASLRASRFSSPSDRPPQKPPRPKSAALPHVFLSQIHTQLFPPSRPKS
jgi:hypothetical protein